MAKGPGGRPRNEWTSPRNRKLVRLWALTTLTKEEIRKLLREDNFDPCPRNITEQLKVLLPKDYAAQFRAYRPSNTASMKLRLSRLHQVQEGRVSKSRQKLNPHSRQHSSSRSSALADRIQKEPVAFLNYLENPSPALLDHLSSIVCPESQPTISSRLMLDGSTICSDSSSTIPRHREVASKARQSVISLSSDSFQHLSGLLRDRSSSSLRHIYAVLRQSHSYSDRTSISWRSSWTSITSTIPEIPNPLSSWSDYLSKSERKVWLDIIDENQVVDTISPRRHRSRNYYGSAFGNVSPSRRQCCESLMTIEKWSQGENCLVCGSSYHHSLARHSRFRSYDGKIEMACWLQDCACDLTRRQDINIKDYFGYTPLHHAAASGGLTLQQVVFAVKHGADIFATNTSGQTFMHILKISKLASRQRPDGLADFTALLTHLKTLNFPFAHRDCHGQTLAHVYFRNADILTQGFPSNKTPGDCFHWLIKVIDILEPDLESVDNWGTSVNALIEDIARTTLGGGSHYMQHSTLDRYRNPMNRKISFRTEISRNSWHGPDWPENLKRANLISWIDCHGDTPLTAILKHWKNDDEELQLREVVVQLIDFGVDVNMRDRNGHTALAIAAVRGSRSCVAALLSAGAMSNARNYQDVSIIKAARMRLKGARKAGRDKCYARILSCITLLADNGALADPDCLEEWVNIPATDRASRGQVTDYLISLSLSQSGFL